MLISVIVAAYNVEYYIFDCLFSLYLQKDENLEVIIINDGSTDNTSLRISVFLNNHGLCKNPKWRIIHQNNKGLSVTRNNGINLAKGKYIMFLDGDDALSLNSVKCLRQSILEHQEFDVLTFAGSDFRDTQLGVNTRNYYSLNDNFTRSYTKKQFANQVLNGPEYLNLAYTLGEFYPSACCMLINLDFIKRENIYFLKDIYFEDNLFTRILYFRAKTVFIINKPILLRRIRNGSITNSNWSWKKTKSMIIVLKNLEIFEKKWPFMKTQNQDFARQIVQIHRKNAISIIPSIIPLFLRNSIYSNKSNRSLLFKAFKESIKRMLN